MNFLAHLVLAPQTPAGLVGSIAPDLIRGPLPRDLDPAVARAAVEHQAIDRFTDAHSAFHRTRRHLAGLVDPRLAGVLADVLYDHVLAHGWADYREDAFDDFVGTAERTLDTHHALMPEPMRVVVSRMIDERWLASYADPRGLRERFSAMSRRLTRRFNRPMDLTLTVDQIDRSRDAIADDFAELWPALTRHVADHRRHAESARHASEPPKI
ncbi:MAG: ACP phosphodiesterase [Phycisphaeraceae bacterium]